MSPRRAPSRSTWPIALLAMLALFVQALVPAAAMAREAGGEPVVICTADGARTIEVAGEKSGEKAPKGFAGLPCAQCVAVSLATVTPPDVAVVPVLYAARIEPAARAAPAGAVLARIPPRPPGQGPPTA